ncbi:DNA (cytosine-5)-methyltransferase 1, partial [Thoreauomyces humboldtii]
MSKHQSPVLSSEATIRPATLQLLRSFARHVKNSEPQSIGKLITSWAKQSNVSERLENLGGKAFPFLHAEKETLKDLMQEYNASFLFAGRSWTYEKIPNFADILWDKDLKPLPSRSRAVLHKDVFDLFNADDTFEGNYGIDIRVMSRLGANIPACRKSEEAPDAGTYGAPYVYTPHGYLCSNGMRLSVGDHVQALDGRIGRIDELKADAGKNLCTIKLGVLCPLEETEKSKSETDAVNLSKATALFNSRWYFATVDTVWILATDIKSHIDVSTGTNDDGRADIWCPLRWIKDNNAYVTYDQKAYNPPHHPRLPAAFLIPSKKGRARLLYARSSKRTKDGSAVYHGEEFVPLSEVSSERFQCGCSTENVMENEWVMLIRKQSIGVDSSVSVHETFLQYEPRIGSPPFFLQGHKNGVHPRYVQFFRHVSDGRKVRHIDRDCDLARMFPAFAEEPSHPKVLEVWGGAGISSQGFVQAAFQKIGTIENNYAALQTNVFNSPKGSKIFRSSSQDEESPTDGFAVALAFDQGILAIPKVDCVASTSPCTFAAGANAFKDGSKAASDRVLLLADLSLKLIMKPHFGFLENVPNVATLFPRLWAGYRLLLMLHGYQLQTGVIECADFGLPQSRRRLFMMYCPRAAQTPQWPAPTHAKSTAGKNFELFPAVTIKEAIGDLHEVAAYSKPHLLPPRTSRTSTADSGSSTDGSPAPTDKWESRKGKRFGAIQTDLSK